MGNRCARLERLISGADDGYSERLRGFQATLRDTSRVIRRERRSLMRRGSIPSLGYSAERRRWGSAPP
jgi:hypothetical protein